MRLLRNVFGIVLVVIPNFFALMRRDVRYTKGAPRA
jgi:hypothetical protein